MVPKGDAFSFRFCLMCLFGFYISLSSCDPSSTIKYEIANLTSKTIVVKYRFLFEPAGDTSGREVSIPTNETRIISQRRVLGFTTNYVKTHDSINVIYLIVQSDDKISHKNLNDKKLWFLDLKSNTTASYRLIVQEDFFR